MASTRRPPKRQVTVTEATRERILQGAALAFGRLGYAVTRVEDVLEEARVSRPTFYKAFDGKDDVFDALSEQHHREIQARIVRSLRGVRDPGEQVAAMVDTFMRWRAELGPVGRVLDQEARTPGSRLAKHRSETLQSMTSFGAERLRRAGRAAVDPVVYYGLIAAMESIADRLLSAPPVGEGAILRAKESALRILTGTLA